jgi:hypothetical protein
MREKGRSSQYSGVYWLRRSGVPPIHRAGVGSPGGKGEINNCGGRARGASVPREREKKGTCREREKISVEIGKEWPING